MKTLLKQDLFRIIQDDNKHEYIVFYDRLELSRHRFLISAEESLNTYNKLLNYFKNEKSQSLHKEISL